MARLRYARTLAQVQKAREADPEFLSSRVRSIRAVYETDPAIPAALLPKPLLPAERPEVCVTCSHVAMQISPQYTLEIGSAVFGVKASYDGVEGIYLITMPMTTEQAVIGGRETFGEPKKIAAVQFELPDAAGGAREPTAGAQREPAAGAQREPAAGAQRTGREISASVSRMGFRYLGLRGTIGEALAAREFTEYGYCFKAMPSCDRSRHLDAEPLLVRLEWRHAQDVVHRVTAGEVSLGESPLDPVADLPVRRLVRMEYEEGTTRSNGTVLRSVPAEWLLPFLHQRYDDPSGECLELPDPPAPARS